MLLCKGLFRSKGGTPQYLILVQRKLRHGIAKFQNVGLGTVDLATWRQAIPCQMKHWRRKPAQKPAYKWHGKQYRAQHADHALHHGSQQCCHRPAAYWRVALWREVQPLQLSQGTVRMPHADVRMACAFVRCGCALSSSYHPAGRVDCHTYDVVVVTLHSRLCGFHEETMS